MAEFIVPIDPGGPNVIGPMVPGSGSTVGEDDVDIPVLSSESRSVVAIAIAIGVGL